MSLVCMCITAEDVDGAIAEAHKAKDEGANLAELRLDFIRDVHGDDWQRIVSGRPLPLIVTNRPTWEGGRSEEGEDERLQRLLQAEQLGAELIDVELKSAPRFHELHAQQRGKSTDHSAVLILSHHDFSATPSDDELARLHAEMLKRGADICKLCVFANDISDCARVQHLLQGARVSTISFAMSERGVITRLLASKFGSYLTFAAAADNRGSAPGQVSLHDMLYLYRYRKVDAFSEVYGIVGKPVHHSMSPAVHNSAFARRRRNAVYVPLLVDDFARFWHTFRPLGLFSGVSVTIPHKEAALSCADEVDDVARRIGAANTLVRLRDGRYKAYNTDWLAAVGAVEDALRGRAAKGRAGGGDDVRYREEDDDASEGGSRGALEGLHVVVIGAGGSAKALAFGAVARGARKLSVVNRTLSRAQSLVAALDAGGDARTQCEARPLEQLSEHQPWLDDVRVIMNASSIGMTPEVDRTPMPKEVLRADMVVFDAIYTPRRTRMLREAEEVGCTTVFGVEMFIRQALAQFELWTGTPAPRDVMEAVIVDRLPA